MAIPVPSVPGVTAYIVAAIQNQITINEPLATAATIGVYTGDEPTRDRPADIIKTGHVIMPLEVTTFIGSGGPLWLNEDYELEITVSNWDGDGSMQPPTGVARAWQLMGYVTTAIRTDPSLGGLVDMAYPSHIEGGQAVWTENPVGRQVDLVLTVKVSNLN